MTNRHKHAHSTRTEQTHMHAKNQAEPIHTRARFLFAVTVFEIAIGWEVSKSTL